MFLYYTFIMLCMTRLYCVKTYSVSPFSFIDQGRVSTMWEDAQVSTHVVSLSGDICQLFRFAHVSDKPTFLLQGGSWLPYYSGKIDVFVKTLLWSMEIFQLTLRERKTKFTHSAH